MLSSKFSGIFLGMGKNGSREILYKSPTLARKVTNSQKHLQRL